MHKKNNMESRGLPGGPNEVFTYVTGVFSTEGYKKNSPDVNNPYNIIDSGSITMEGVDFPVMGTDNLGNSQMMTPGNNYQFPGDQVFEIPMAKRGGGLLDKTMECNNCGWKWKAADGGADVSTCHKCGGSALPKAQDGVEFSVCSSQEMQPNGTFLPGCQGGGYKETVLRPYAGFGITSGMPSGEKYTASGRASLGLAGHLNNSPFTGHLGANAGGRLNYKNDKIKVNPLFNATGSVGLEGEFDLGKNDVSWGAGVYGNQDLLNNNGFTGGVYGNLNKFSAKVGYNSKTGPEATIGFGLPIRQTGGEEEKETETKDDSKPWIQDYNFTQADLNFLNSDEDYCPGGECLEQSFKVQDIMFGGKRGFATSTETKNDLGLQSANKRKLGYPYYNEDGVLMRENPDERMRRETPVSDETKDWLESVPYFDIDSRSGGDYTADSWDIHGIMVEAGGKNLFTRGLYDSSYGEDDSGYGRYGTPSMSDLSEDQLKKLYSEITIGTIIGFDAYADKKVKYNEKYGLTPSGHSTMVVGFDERGVPVVYDYGNYTPIDAGTENHSESGKYGTLEPFSAITNITYPPNSKGKTYAWLKEQGMLNTTPKKLDLNYDALETELYAKGNREMLTSFHDSLVDNKRDLMNAMNISNKDYDMISGILLAQTMQESSGGESFEDNVFPNWASQALGDTQGLTQLNINNLLDDEELAPIAAKFGITEESDLFDPKKSAIASMIYGKRNLQAGRKNYEKGKGQKGSRTFYPRDDIRETAGMNVNITFNGYEFKTDEGIIVDFFTGAKKSMLNPFSGYGWDKSMEDIQAQFEKIAPGKYTVREEDGVRVVDKITNGNKGTIEGEDNLSDEEIFAYNWQSPNALRTGDAGGNSEYAKNILRVYNKLKEKNIEKQMGGQIMNEQPEQGLKKFNNGGSEVSSVNKRVYKAYFNKEIKGKKAKDIYDKLNRVYYRDAKAKNMSSPNYILTHVIT